LRIPFQEEQSEEELDLVEVKLPESRRRVAGNGEGGKGFAIMALFYLFSLELW